MKTKMLAAAALAALLFTAGCGADTDAPAANDAPAAPAGTTEAAAPAETTEAAAPAETEEAPAADGDFAVTIDGSTVTKDYEGNPAIVVDFTFTNNSEETTSFMVAVHAKAFQDGVQLEPAMIMDDAAYKAGEDMKDIRPGASIPVQQAFALTSESPVEIEVEEFMSFDNTKLATAELPAK